MADIKNLKEVVRPSIEKLRGLAGEFKLPEAPKVRAEILDSFGPKLLNQVMKNLKSMLSLRPERGVELAAKRQMAETARQSSTAGMVAKSQTGVAGTAGAAGSPSSKGATDLPGTAGSKGAAGTAGTAGSAGATAAGMTTEGIVSTAFSKEMPPTGPVPPVPMIVKGGQAVPEGPAKAAGAGGLFAGAPGASEAAPQETKRELTLFEKVFIARFERGEALGEKLEPGRQQFLGKTAEGWKAFFGRFLPFTFQRKGNMAEVQAVVYRGVVPEEKGAAKARAAAMLVSDLKFQARTDRFARLEIPNSTILEKIASLMPGEMLEKALVAEWVAAMKGTEFSYLALSHKMVQPDLVRSMARDQQPAVESSLQRSAAHESAHVVSREPQQGIALTARAEQRAAEQLELSWRPAVGGEKIRGGEERGTAAVGGAMGERPSRAGGLGVGRGRHRKGKGLFGFRWGEEEIFGGSVFVPWYQQMLKFKKFPGRPRWFIALSYFVFFSTIALVAVYVFKFLLQR